MPEIIEQYFPTIIACIVGFITSEAGVIFVCFLVKRSLRRFKEMMGLLKEEHTLKLKVLEERNEELVAKEKELEEKEKMLLDERKRNMDELYFTLKQLKEVLKIDYANNPALIESGSTNKILSILGEEYEEEQQE